MTAPSSETNQRLRATGSLTDLVDARTLMRIVFEAVDATAWPAPRNRAAGVSECVLRTLTVFCYASGRFSSRDIETAARFDADIRYLCASDFPTWQELLAFRRRNLKWITETLARVIQAAGEEVGVALPFFVCLEGAGSRLRVAIEADSAEMDD
jgi:hypothetical protein